MGTRADFWIGHGPEAEWLGSVAWDGMEWQENPDCALMTVATEEHFRIVVGSILGCRDDATRPEHGWPWPWEDSRLTDFAYVFDDGKTNVYSFGAPVAAEGDDDEPPKRTDWRDMSEVKNVTFGARSGVVIVGGEIIP